jgi:hypothetical protein
MRHQDDMTPTEWEHLVRSQPSTWLWRRLNRLGIYKNPNPEHRGMGRSVLLIVLYMVAILLIFELFDLSASCRSGNEWSCAVSWLLTGLVAVSFLALIRWFHARYK